MLLLLAVLELALFVLLVLFIEGKLVMEFELLPSVVGAVVDEEEEEEEVGDFGLVGGFGAGLVGTKFVMPWREGKAGASFKLSERFLNELARSLTLLERVLVPESFLLKESMMLLDLDLTEPGVSEWLPFEVLPEPGVLGAEGAGR